MKSPKQRIEHRVGLILQTLDELSCLSEHYQITQEQAEKIENAIMPKLGKALKALVTGENKTNFKL